jgi:hypothetical protein
MLEDSRRLVLLSLRMADHRQIFKLIQHSPLLFGKFLIKPMPMPVNVVDRPRVNGLSSLGERRRIIDQSFTASSSEKSRQRIWSAKASTVGRGKSPRELASNAGTVKTNAINRPRPASSV